MLELLSSSHQNVLQKPSMMVSDKALGVFFFFLRLLRREGPGGRLQDSGLQRVCWGGGAVPQLPGWGVNRPDCSTSGVPPFALCERVGSPSPSVAASIRPALSSLALGFLPSDRPHLSGIPLTSLPRRTQGSGLAGKLSITSHPQHRPTEWVPAGPTGTPPTCSSGCRPQGSTPRSITSPRPLQAQPTIPSQRNQGFSSQSPVLFFSFYLFLLISL